MVPVSVVVAPELRVVAITGPNTGGKTVALKTVGLAAILVRLGCFVPAACMAVCFWGELHLFPRQIGALWRPAAVRCALAVCGGAARWFSASCMPPHASECFGTNLPLSCARAGPAGPWWPGRWATC